MSWFSWLRRKNEDKPGRLQLCIEYTSDQILSCSADWPAGLGKDANDTIVADFSQLLALIHTGNAQGITQQAIALAGQRLNAENVSRRILHQTSVYLSQTKGAKSQISSDEPIIPADMCFPSRRNKGDFDDD